MPKSSSEDAAIPLLTPLTSAMTTDYAGVAIPSLRVADHGERECARVSAFHREFDPKHCQRLQESSSRLCHRDATESLTANHFTWPSIHF